MVCIFLLVGGAVYYLHLSWYLAGLLLLFLGITGGWPEKLVLAAMDAAPLGHGKWQNIARNYACRLELSKVEVYISQHFPNNVYVVHDWQGGSIVIGRRILETFTPAEIKALIFAAMLALKDHALHRTWMALALMMVYEIFAGLGRILRGHGKSLARIYFYALLYLRDKLQKYGPLQTAITYWRRYDNDLGPLQAALMKIQGISSNSKDLCRIALLEGLALTQSEKQDILLGLLPGLSQTTRRGMPGHVIK
ncbi:MAG: hypothetical protein J6Y94_07630 [Bacteriovoracaceae bacterium]|nr:hypothetical protein [Bacteriovoracaceae bacterium]